MLSTRQREKKESSVWIVCWGVVYMSASTLVYIMWNWFLLLTYWGICSVVVCVQVWVCVCFNVRASTCESCAITLCEVRCGGPLCNCVPASGSACQTSYRYCGLSQFRQVHRQLGTVARSGTGYTWISEPENPPPTVACREQEHTPESKDKESIFGCVHTGLNTRLHLLCGGQPASKSRSLDRPFVEIYFKDALGEYILTQMLSIILYSHIGTGVKSKNTVLSLQGHAIKSMMTFNASGWYAARSQKKKKKVSLVSPPPQTLVLSGSYVQMWRRLTVSEQNLVSLTFVFSVLPRFKMRRSMSISCLCAKWSCSQQPVKHNIWKQGRNCFRL